MFKIQFIETLRNLDINNKRRQKRQIETLENCWHNMTTAEKESILGKQRTSMKASIIKTSIYFNSKCGVSI